ncbi:MAG: hypothetical protein G01um101413_2 [Parcubacteria group bacterium Gr01-1014_13]|nr:MAG: hypothetical protein G01um101413_2 [Parcubacteria group bacterium Gr01-1014_13]
MKKTLVVIIVVFFQTFFVQSAIADKNSKEIPEAKVEKKAKDGKVWYFAALPAYYLGVHIPLHESGHAFAGWLSPNYQVSNFKPWPHYNADGSRFFIGSVDITCVGKACDDKIGSGVIFLAPYITDTVLFTTSDLLLATNTVKPTSIPGRVLYFAGMVVPWWDFSYNAVWAIKGSDADHVARNFEIPRWSVMVAGASVSAVGLWRLWNGYNRAFRGHAKESNLVITPISDSKTIGASVSMRF